MNDTCKPICRPPTAIIIGGGISGLACAYELSRKCPQLQTKIIEKESRAGGVIQSVKRENLLIECGPESFSTLKPEVVELASSLNISEHIIQTMPQNRRSFVSLGRKLRSLPDGLMMFAPSNLWSFALTDIFTLSGKLRMSLDLILPRSCTNADESLSGFVGRRLGQEALHRLAEPMIGGIYGGDPSMLSASSTVPQLVEMERTHGSIIRGLMKARSRQSDSGTSSGPRYGALASFDGGISVLVRSILKNLPEDCLITGKSARHIMPGRNASRWTILCDDNSSYDADFVVLATPAEKSAALLTEVNFSLASKLQKITRSSALIVNLLYDRSKVRHVLNGFGFVVPRTEGMLTSACSFSSIKFAGRSSDDKLLLRLFTGGALKAEAADMSDKQLLKQCHSEMQTLLGVEERPLLHVISRHNEAIPQYLVGHSQLVADIENDLIASPGIELIGNSYTGVGLPDCIRTAQSAARRILDSINHSSMRPLNSSVNPEMIASSI